MTVEVASKRALAHANCMRNLILCYGIDTDYSDNRVLLDHCNDGEWFSPKEYWVDQDEEDRAELNKAMQDWSSCQFMKADESDQWHVLGELEGHVVTGWCESWEYINAHFTKDAAEAFIRRKKHDYGKGMRVYVEPSITPGSSTPSRKRSLTAR